MQAISKPTVYACYHRWKESGVDGLADKPRSGRPPKVTPRYRERLREVLEQEPSAYGYDLTIWAIGRLRAHLAKETGIEISESRMSELLKEEGYRYRRPKQDLSHLQDQEAKKQADELLKELKKGARSRDMFDILKVIQWQRKRSLKSDPPPKLLVQLKTVIKWHSTCKEKDMLTTKDKAKIRHMVLVEGPSLAGRPARCALTRVLSPVYRLTWFVSFECLR